MRKTRLFAIGFGLVAALFTAVITLAPTSAQAEHHTMAPKQAICVLVPTEGNSVSGTITFTQEEGGVRVQAKLSGLTPGKHGFHIHEYGDLSKPDGTGCGGHFNPAGHEHGLEKAPSEKRHVGDLGNIEADEKGEATYDLVDPVISLSGEHSILGRGFIVHAKPDDGGQPTGNAGARVAMGVIGFAAEK